MGTSSAGSGAIEPRSVTRADLYLECGSRITGWPRADLPLEITASLPDGPLRKELSGGTWIEMRVTNVSDSTLRVMTYRDGAFITIGKNGLVVAGPGGRRPAGTSFVLEPGAGRDYKSGINFRRCDHDSANVSPGKYQLYAAQTFTLRDEEPWTQGLVTGGPWDVEIG